MENWKEVTGALLGVLIAVVWLAFAMIGFHVFYAIALTMVLGTLSGGLYAISAKNKENTKIKEG
ncbi:MAG: hypothetical protein JSV62_06290 [Promethearchaeota archaeon]|nr:MAG: hypothetical protein JSV62_06290 [Candidatus Lokiarchaeota archaeon]